MTPELHPKTLDLLREFEGKPRLKARLCEGGRYEVAYGVTYHLDDTPIGPNDTITEDQVMPYTLYALAKEAAPVWAALTRPVTAAQAGALAVLAFNVGGGTVAKSLRQGSFQAVNEGRFEDAAAAFGLYTGATSAGPSPTELAAGTAPKTGQVRQKDGSVKTFILYAKIGNTHRWVPPQYTLLTDKLFELGVQIEEQAKIIAEEATSEEELERREKARARADALIAEQRATQAELNSIKGCHYFRRFRGLLRRHHAEGCLFLGLDWKEATKNDAISMVTEPKWIPERNRWEDQIIRQTEFVEVLEVARRYPLARAPIPQAPDPPVAAPTKPVEVEPLPEIKAEPSKPVEVAMPAEAPAPKEKTVTVPAKPTVNTAQLPYGTVEPISDPKDMIASKRFWGLLIIIVSRFSFLGIAGQTWAGEIVGDPILLDAAAAGLAMGALFFMDAGGQLLHMWGKRDAKGFLQ